MVATLGLPTIFFTHSAADLQWPELARLICPDNGTDLAARTNKAYRLIPVRLVTVGTYRYTGTYTCMPTGLKLTPGVKFTQVY